LARDDDNAAAPSFLSSLCEIVLTRPARRFPPRHSPRRWKAKGGS
jgi:hypothetical protein